MHTLPAGADMSRKHPKLTEEQYINFLRRKEELQNRFTAALRLEPYEHRPWDRGYNIYQGSAA